MRDEQDNDGAAPLDEVLGFQLRRAHMMFAEHWQRSFRDEPDRVTPMQGGMLLTIEWRPGLTQAALARLMGVEGPTLMQALDRLEQGGLVQRSRRADDRRSYALHLTDRGHQAVIAVKQYVPHREAELLTGLSEKERAILLDLLKRVVRRGHDLLEQNDAPEAAAQTAVKKMGENEVRRVPHPRRRPISRLAIRSRPAGAGPGPQGRGLDARAQFRRGGREHPPRLTAPQEPGALASGW